MNTLFAFGAPEHTLTCTQWAPAPMEEVFPFFEDPHNLSKITPPGMGFHILSMQPDTIQKGARIVYRLHLMGISCKWHTLIQEWKPGEMFVDYQERGPYILWRHTHQFEVRENGVLMTDTVLYRVPFGWIGTLLHRLVIRKQIEAIFKYRRMRVADIYSGGVEYTEPPRIA